MMKLGLTTPPTESRAARDAQWLMAGNNRWKDSDLPIRTYRGRIDGVYGEQSGHAANRTRHWLGYPAGKVNLGGRFGEQLYSYLLPLDNPRARKLPATYRARRKLRILAEKRRLAAIAAQRSPKTRALALALSKVGIEERPFGTNRTPFGVWYGWNGVAWCSIFVTYCLHLSGWRKAKTALAFQWEWWARARQHGLSITFNPEPGDAVVYHFGQGHVGLFRRWIDRRRGLFEAVEGNTSLTSDDNGGKVMIRQRSLHTGRPTFIRWN